MSNNMNKTVKTALNKKFRLPISVNARKYKGERIPYACYWNDATNQEVVRYLDQYPENGGTLTPFNIQTNVAGACAIRNIVKQGRNTIVVFADGDRISLHRHDGDNDDVVTAVLWALGQKLFGTGLVRQIRNAVKYRLVDADEKHLAKAKSKDVNATAV